MIENIRREIVEERRRKLAIEGAGFCGSCIAYDVECNGPDANPFYCRQCNSAEHVVEIGSAVELTSRATVYCERLQMVRRFCLNAINADPTDDTATEGEVAADCMLRGVAREILAVVFPENDPYFEAVDNG